LPLLSVVSDENLRDELRAMALSTQMGVIAERGLLVEAQVLEILAQLMEASQRPVVPVADLVVGLTERYGNEYERPLTNKWVGGILRRRLNIHTYKSHGVYVVPASERTKIDILCTRYGVQAVAKTQPGDLGTLGTL
jgi:hypothetical protein